MPKQTALDPAILEAALVGLEHQKSEIDAKAAAIRRMPRSGPASKSATVSTAAMTPRRRRSAAARRRMAVAQRKRWAAVKQAKAAPAKKRTMSAAARKRIADATRKRWAAFRA